MAGIAFGLSDLLVGSLSNLGELFRTGTLDALLLRPLPAMAQICLSEFALRRVARSAPR